MTKRETRETLEQLRYEIEHTRTDSHARQEILDYIKQQIDRALAEEADERDDHPRSLLDRLNHAINEFGSEHPQLTAAIDRAIAILNTGGV